MGFGLNLYELVRIPISRRCNGYYLRWYYNGWHYWLWYPGRIGFITEGEKYRTLGTQTLTIGSGQITEEQVRAIRTIKNTKEISIYTDSGWAVVHLIQGSVITHNNQIHGYEIEITIIIGSKQISKDGFSPAISIPVVDPSYEYCETMCIGDQIWMCKNYDSKYPGSRVYNNDEDNRDEYGGLYKHSQVMASGFVPAGWHIPTIAEWQELIDFVGDDSDAGGILKETNTQWYLPSKDELTAMYVNLHLFGLGSFAGIIYWSSTEEDFDSAYFQNFNDGTTGINDKDEGATVHVRACRSFIAAVGSYSLRDIGPAGGLIFYINGIGTTYFEAAPTDQSVEYDWSNVLLEIGATAQGTAIGTGQSNTAAIIAQAGHEYSAAQICDDLSTITHWDAPNTGAVDTYSFAAVGGGRFGFLLGVGTQYHYLKTYGFFWAQDGFIRMDHDSAVVTVGAGIILPNEYYSVRLLRNEPCIQHAYGEWVLPSWMELTAMYDNLQAFGVGNFAADRYWSSYETSATNAIAVEFSMDAFENANKANSFSVRAARSFITTAIYELRDVGPRGGWIFYIIDNGDGSFTYYECAPADQSSDCVWSNITNAAIGTTQPFLGSGLGNTAAIIAQAGHTDSAAKLCDDLNKWSLPSQDELRLMYINLHLFGMGGFTAAQYWTSSEMTTGSGLSNTHAYFNHFGTGVETFQTKGTAYRVRASRKFTEVGASYNLRDTGPKGGLIYYIDGDDYYESYLTDQSASQVWSNIDNIEVGIAAQGVDVGDGRENTLAIIAQTGHINSAAKLCNNLN